MRAMRRFAKDESGWALPLALIMIVLIGAMGAGLLTFAGKDLNAVTETNKGEKASEVAEAGVQAAKRQLTSDCVGSTTCMDHYDDNGTQIIGTQDIQWSLARGGMTLNNLDGGVPVSDSAIVTVDYRYTTNDFLVLSTATRGDAKRKIEAIFKGAGGSGGGNGVGLPTYFTPSTIRIDNPLTIGGISLFSQSDIIINNITSSTGFKTDYEDNGGTLKLNGNTDQLSDWDSTKFAAPNTGTWNTVGRKGHTGYNNPCNKSSSVCDRPGFAALGKICGYTGTTKPATCGSATSVADGVYGYDSTTGTKGNNLTFVNKSPQDKNPNDANTITFPFPRPTPNPERLRGYAQETGKYYQGTSPNWDTLFPNGGTSSQVVFIDAQGGTLNFSTSNSANNKGILVVWCGNLQLNAKFQGIVLNLYPQSSGQLPGGSTCDNSKGIVTNNGQDFSGWLYAQGGNSTTPGIVLKDSTDHTTNPSMNNLPSASWTFFQDAFTGAPPTSIGVGSWRELY